jgi:hypothetical protein
MEKGRVMNDPAFLFRETSIRDVKQKWRVMEQVGRLEVFGFFFFVGSEWLDRKGENRFNVFSST